MENIYFEQFKTMEGMNLNNVPTEEFKRRFDLFSYELEHLYSMLLATPQLNTTQWIFFVTAMLDKLPQYFFKVAASSTGKYHPKCSLGEGGLLRHTKLGMKVAQESFVLTTMFDLAEDEQVMSYIALMFHDGFKHGYNGNPYTEVKHPNYIKQEMMDMIDTLIDEGILEKNGFDVEQLRIMAIAVSKHMGQWCYDYRSKKKVLDKPESTLELFIHMCDYMASRKMFDYYVDMMEGV